MVSSPTPPSRVSYARIREVLEVPDLIEIQRKSYKWFQEEGLAELFADISPVKDYTGTRLELYFLEHRFGEPKYSEEECREKGLTYAAPLKVKARLIVKETGEIKEQEVFMGDFPLMTSAGTFIVNGAERVVVNQLIRSPGVYFTTVTDPASGRQLCFAKLVPDRGAWLEFETTSRGVILVKIDRKRKMPVTILLRAVGYGSDEELLELFADVDTDPEHPYIRNTIEKDPQIRSETEALLEFYRRLRPGEPPTIENARGLLHALFFDYRRYRLGKGGRYKLNKRLGLELPQEQQTLTPEDLVAVVRRILMINNGLDSPDDVDHLGNRRVRAVGELLQSQLQAGLLRLERAIRERMSLISPSAATPANLVDNRAVISTVREFFGSFQLSQFMDQTNPLAELTHKRRLSALGPGGFSRERAGFEIRDVHHSHYGRICPIETPEGRNIGLITSLATYARVNPYGFIETPYRRVVREVENEFEKLVGRTLYEPVHDEAGHLLAEAGTEIDEKLAHKLAGLPPRKIRVRPFASREIVYLSADEEENYVIAQASAKLNEKEEFTEGRVEARQGKRFVQENPERVDFMDISPNQVVSVSAALIPFLEHDDANRALMGSNMQRQAVPLIKPEAPIVGTGMEREVGRNSGQVIFAPVDGEIISATAERIILRGDDGKEYVYPLRKFCRSNQGTCINQYPVVDKGQRVRRGDVLADSYCTDQGELALGQNVICAFLSWEGYNYEDAIVISEKLVREDKFTSIHIEKYEVEARETKLGPEEITRDIPNVGEASLRNLDERGIVRIGAEVSSGDILVGKLTPKGEKVLTAEEKLLRAIFGEKARDVKDTSLRMPHGESGKVIGVRVLSRENKDQLEPGVLQLVEVFVAQKRKLSEGDKLAGRHGNKGVIAKILPVEDMPYLPDGRPVDVLLSPLGIPSRMNVGQLFEAHLGWAAEALGFKALTPVFNGADEVDIEDELARAWFVQKARGHGIEEEPTKLIERAKAWLKARGFDGERLFNREVRGEARRACLKLWLAEQGEEKAYDWEDQKLQEAAQRLFMEKKLAPPIFGKLTLYDGRTGEPFDQPVTVGCMYLMKLIHLVEDKIHARSTGPYSLITQQPLGGKAQFGGQRFGEMEVWALEAYGAAYNLQEMLTVKSDDVQGRVRTYGAIIKGEEVLGAGVPESFKVLVKELQSLGLAVELIGKGEELVPLESPPRELPRLGISLTGPETEEIDDAGTK